MQTKWILISLVVGFLSACATKPPLTPSLPDAPPTSFQASFIEAYSVNAIIVRATGLGIDNQDALNNARKTAIWFALFADQPALLNEQQQQKFKAHQGYFYAHAARYVLHEGALLDRRIEQGQTQISRDFRLNLSALRADLIEKNIIPPLKTRQLSDPSVSIISDSPHADAVFADYLQTRGWRVAVLDQQSRINDLITQAAQLSGNLDPHYLLALQAGNDIYVELDWAVSERQLANQRLAQASVSAKAYFTSTGQQIASATGFSTERHIAGSQAIITEAAQQAAHRLTGQLNQAWSQQRNLGREFKLVFSVEAEMGDLSETVHQLLQSSCQSVKRQAAGTRSFDYLVVCELEDSVELMRLLVRNYTGIGNLTRVYDSGQLLMINVGYNTHSNEIFIE
ncbi:DUF6175 family protein [Thiomicrospira sp. R3]|uniref:DUF6175 family protein n=1 Tax=Thiomicrospira sp. R3 TaxID=3035472 RepID=UPI00259B7C3E|nr:DUF6175 family protein [Thiomicrospira sp. R3]WFE68663.1 DUF6175 family protein [Thiomicrospira sp. R3]